MASTGDRNVNGALHRLEYYRLTARRIRDFDVSPIREPTCDTPFS